MTNETITKLQFLLENTIKKTIAHSMKWKNIKEAMLEEDAFTSTAVFKNYIKYNTNIGKQISYDKSYFCELTNQDSKSYLLLTHSFSERTEGAFEFYAFVPGKTKLVEFTCPEIQSLLRRLNNAITYGYESEEEINVLKELLLPDSE